MVDNRKNSMTCEFACGVFFARMEWIQCCRHLATPYHDIWFTPFLSRSCNLSVFFTFGAFIETSQSKMSERFVPSLSNEWMSNGEPHWMWYFGISAKREVEKRRWSKWKKKKRFPKRLNKHFRVQTDELHILLSSYCVVAILTIHCAFASIIVIIFSLSPCIIGFCVFFGECKKQKAHSEIFGVLLCIILYLFLCLCVYTLSLISYLLNFTLVYSGFSCERRLPNSYMIYVSVFVRKLFS